MGSALLTTSIPSGNLVSRGKVRDIYTVGENHLLIVTTDRLSAFDVILPDPIPGKGAVLTATSNFWFERMKDVVPNQLSDMTLEQALPDADERAQVEGRAIVVKKLNALPIEAIVRGYLIGSGWKDYQQTGTVCGIKLPEGLQLADRLPKAIYTPSTKAEAGEHDENISYEKSVDLMGEKIASKVRDYSLQIYNEAAAYALERGIIIADTKFEFGLDDEGELYLIDEVLRGRMEFDGVLVTDDMEMTGALSGGVDTPQASFEALMAGNAVRGAARAALAKWRASERPAVAERPAQRLRSRIARCKKPICGGHVGITPFVWSIQVFRTDHPGTGGT